MCIFLLKAEKEHTVLTCQGGASGLAAVTSNKRHLVPWLLEKAETLEEASPRGTDRHHVHLQPQGECASGWVWAPAQQASKAL